MFRPRLLTSACIEITLIYNVEIAGIFKKCLSFCLTVAFKIRKILLLFLYMYLPIYTIDKSILQYQAILFSLDRCLNIC